MLPAIFNENLFDDFFDDRFMMPSVFGKNDPLYGKNAKNVMKTDVRETENTYELDIDLPGFIGAAKSLEKDSGNDKDGKYIRRERYEGQCSRSFFVGKGVQARDISAKFEDGILKVSVPKTAQPEANNYIAIE